MIEILATIECDPSERYRTGFTCGIVLQDDIVVEAALIVGFMKQRKFTRDQVRTYCAARQWRISVVHKLERERPKEPPDAKDSKA